MQAMLLEGAMQWNGWIAMGAAGRVLELYVCINLKGWQGPDIEHVPWGVQACSPHAVPSPATCLHPPRRA